MSQQAPSSSVPEMEHRHTSVPPSDGVDSNAPTDVNDDVQEKSGKPDDAEQATAAAAPSASVAPVAPDGGARAWMVLGGGFCTAFCTFGWLNSMHPVPLSLRYNLLSWYPCKGCWLSGHQWAC